MTQNVTYKDVARFTWHYWGRRPVHLVLSFAVVGAAAFLDTLFPYVISLVVRAIEDHDGLEGTIPKALIMAILALILVEFLYHTVRNVAYWLWNRFAVRTLYDIVTESFGKVQRFSTDWHANNFAGATVRKITRGMWSFDTYEDIFFMFLFPTTVVAISTVTLLMIQWPLIGFVTLIMSVLYVALSLWAVLVINAPRFRRSAAEDTKVGAALADAVTANSAVKTFGTERSEDRMFAHVAENWRGIALNSWQVATWTDLARRYMSTLMFLAMLAAALHLWTKDQATAADVVYVLMAFIVLSQYLRNIGEQTANLQRAVSEMEDVVWFWKTGIAVEDAPDAKIFKPAQGEIVFDRVGFAYDNQNKRIYDDFSITIAPGEKVALVGHSGSGKSTFVKLVQRLYDIQSGEIRIDGQNVASVTQESLRQAIALVPQELILFHRSLADNIAYGKPDANMEDIIEAAEQAYAHEFITGLPEEYGTLVGERGIKLSGGERQRVAIARAILADAPILILDEATSSLDSISEHYIQKALANLMRGRTTITIAHRLATIKSVDRILVFDQGRIVEQGTHDSLLCQESSHYKRLTCPT